MAYKQEIITKFYDLHEKLSVIAKELNVNPSYVTKVIQKDCRYIPEKEYRAKIRYDKNSSDLVLRKGFKYACDVPKRVCNIINPTQRRVIC